MTPCCHFHYHNITVDCRLCTYYNPTTAPHQALTAVIITILGLWDFKLSTNLQIWLPLASSYLALLVTLWLIVVLCIYYNATTARHQALTAVIITILGLWDFKLYINLEIWLPLVSNFLALQIWGIMLMGAIWNDILLSFPLA